jgi:hypothetical protein
MKVPFRLFFALGLVFSTVCSEDVPDKFSFYSCSLQGAQSQTFFLSDGLYPIPSQTLDASLYAIGKVSLQGSFIKSQSLEMHVTASASLNDWNSTIAAVVNTSQFPLHTSGFKYHSVFNDHLQKLLASASKSVLLRSRVLVLLPLSSSLKRSEWAPMPPSLFHREFGQKLSPLLVSLSPLGEASKQPKLVHTMQRLHAISQGPRLSSSVSILLYLHRFSISAVPAPQILASNKRNSTHHNDSNLENRSNDERMNSSTSASPSLLDAQNNNTDTVSITHIIGSVKEAEPVPESSDSFRSLLISLFFWLKGFYANILWLVSRVAWPMSRAFRFIYRSLTSLLSSILAVFNLSSSSDSSYWVDVESVPDTAHVSSTDFGHRSHLSINASVIADDLPTDLDRSTIDSSLRWDITSFLVKDLSYQEFIERWPRANFSVTLSTDRHNSLPCGAASVMREQLADLLTKDVRQLMPLLNSMPKSPDLVSESCVPPKFSSMNSSHSGQSCPNTDADVWPLFPTTVNCTAMEHHYCAEGDSSDPVLSASGGIEAVGLIVRVWRRSLLSCTPSAVHAVPYALRASVLQENPQSNSSNFENAFHYVQKTLNFTRSDCLWSYPYSASRGAFLFELFASIGILLTMVSRPATEAFRHLTSCSFSSTGRFFVPGKMTFPARSFSAVHCSCLEMRCRAFLFFNISELCAYTSKSVPADICVQCSCWCSDGLWCPARAHLADHR